MTSWSFVNRTCACLALLGGFLVAVVSAVTPAPAPTGTEPLLQQSDLKYEGAFRLPVGPTDQTSFAYGGTGMAYNPARNSLFMVGHV